MRKLIIVVCALAAAGYFFPACAEPITAKPELVKVPAGSFQMGSKEFLNSQPVRRVSFSEDFYLGKYEVTNRQYAEVLNYALAQGYLDSGALSETAKRREARGIGKAAQKYQDVFDEHSQITFENGVFKAHPGKEEYPVVEVSWYGAAFYCNMLSLIEGLEPLYDPDNWTCQVYGKTGYRLPTEAEWEYAATYNDGRPFPWGRKKISSRLANVLRNVKNPADVDTRAVGSFSPKGDSKLGLSDLAGNVAEWCNDWYSDAYSGEGTQIDPVGPGKVLFFNLPVFKEFRAARVVRGGSFLYDPDYRKEMGPPFVMDTVIHKEVYNNRFRSFDHLSRQVIGFRVVKIMAGPAACPVFSEGQ